MTQTICIYIIKEPIEDRETQTIGPLCLSIYTYEVDRLRFHNLYQDLKSQSTLVISASLTSTNRLSGSENLVLLLTWRSNNR